MPRLTLLISLAATFLAACRSGQTVTLRDTVTPQFRPGQVWNYVTRPGEERSLAVVTKVEEAVRGDDTTVIVHLYIDGLNIQHPDGGVVEVIPHMPFTEDALFRSLTFPGPVVEDLPDFQSAYELWREAYLKGDAGVFDISVSAAVSSLEASLTE